MVMALCTSTARAQETSATAVPAALGRALEVSAKRAEPDSTSKQPAASGSDLEAARAAFWEAHRRFEAADYAAALGLFQESYALFAQPELVFNIALTHEHLGNCAAALETYDRYLGAPGARAEDDGSERAADKRAELARRCELPPSPPAPEEPIVLTAPLSVVTAVKATPSGSATLVPAAVLSDSGARTPEDSELQTQLGWATLGAAVMSLGAVVYLDVQRRKAHSEHAEARRDYEQNLTPSAADDVNDAASRFYRTYSISKADKSSREQTPTSTRSRGGPTVKPSIFISKRMSPLARAPWEASTWSTSNMTCGKPPNRTPKKSCCSFMCTAIQEEPQSARLP